MKYSIVETTDDSIYCVVENGGTFGQMIYGESRKTFAGIEGVINEAIERNAPQQEISIEIVRAIEGKTQIELPAKEDEL